MIKANDWHRVARGKHIVFLIVKTVHCAIGNALEKNSSSYSCSPSIIRNNTCTRGVIGEHWAWNEVEEKYTEQNRYRRKMLKLMIACHKIYRRKSKIGWVLKLTSIMFCQKINGFASKHAYNVLLDTLDLILTVWWRIPTTITWNR